MEPGRARLRPPPRERDELRVALATVALDPDARPGFPFRYFIDQLERRYGQPPGSAETWPIDAFLRAVEYVRLESNVRVTRG